MNSHPDVDHKLIVAIERLARALRAARQLAATRHELSLLGLGVLETLADERRRRVADLAAELDVSQPTVSDAVTALERRGLVVRQRSRDDQRSSVVALSEAGVATARQIAADLSPVLAASAGSTGDRTTALRVVLGEIARLQTAGIITVNRSCFACRHYRAPRSRAAARCLLLDTALADHDLRVDCPEHEPATASGLSSPG